MTNKFKLIKVDGDKKLSLNGINVMQIHEDELHISLYWLREAGFKGEILISEEYSDRPFKFNEMIQ